MMEIERLDSSELETLSASTIQDAIYRLDEEMAGIRFSLDEYKEDLSSGAIEADGDWRRRAEYAMARKKINRQKLQNALAVVRKAEKACKHDETQRKRLFETAAREILPREVFMQIALRAEAAMLAAAPEVE